MIVYRRAVKQDIDALWHIETSCFNNDRLSKRQLRFWATAPHGIMLVAEQAAEQTKEQTDSLAESQNSAKATSILGYGLVIMRKGTSLARLYSLAVLPSARGLGIAKHLIQQLEDASVAEQKLFLRLEVSTQNTSAIALYKALGYKTFGHYSHYYEDESDALRMQKAIYQQASAKRLQAYPYYQQSTAFTCGPSALMMAMSKLMLNQHQTDSVLRDSVSMADDNVSESQSLQAQGARMLNQSEELAIWRQATTIFMTSGHGGTHPLGLALAAIDRGFKVDVYINQALPLFLAGVRHPQKKQVLQKVEEDFLSQALAADANIFYQDFSRADIASALAAGSTVICLISSYQFDGYKGPHWVTVTHIDDEFLYIHDPEPYDEDSAEILNAGGERANNDSALTPFADRQHVPVSLDTFERYTRYGAAKLRTALFISPVVT